MILIYSSPHLNKKKTILRFATSILSPTKRLKTRDATPIVSCRWVRTTPKSREASTTAKASLKKTIATKKVTRNSSRKINTISRTRASDQTGISLNIYSSSRSNYSRRASSSNNKWLSVRIIRTRCNMRHLIDAMNNTHRKTRSTIKTLPKPITQRKVETQETRTRVHSSKPMLLKSHRRKRCFDKWVTKP